MSDQELSTTAIAERYVIGAIMSDPNVLRPVQEAVIPSDFHDMRLGAVYAGICQMAAAREPVDYLTVADRLGEWDVRGVGVAELAAWSGEVPSAKNAPYYAAQVREAALLRTLRAEGDRLRQATGEPGLLLNDTIDRLRDIRDRDASGVKPVRMLADVLNVPESEDTYDWVIPNVLERRDRLMLTGSEGGGKSTMLRQLAVLSAAGLHPFTFTQIPPVRVLVVDAENSERQWRRAVRDMADRAAQHGQRDPRFHLALECTPKLDVTNAGDLGMVHRRIDEVNPDLLLIGPLYRLVGGKPIDKDTEVAPVLSALDGLRERGVAMLIEAHAGHASSTTGQRDLRPRGSSALLGWPEFGLGLQRLKLADAGGRVGFGLVRWRGDRDARPFPQKFARGQFWPWEPTVAMG